MSQRHSEYDLLPSDSYYTPAWVTEALLAIEDFPKNIWEPAAGNGHMTEVLKQRGHDVVSGDIQWGPQMDFLKLGADWMGQREAIVTNPPYSNGLAEKFVRHALKLTDPVNGKVAMLLPLAWDSAKTRRDLFAEHPAFKAKYTLTRRIRWENLKQKKNGPSQNHAWYVWDWGQGPFIGPVLGYLP